MPPATRKPIARLKRLRRLQRLLMRRQRGLTIIELMLVVMLIGILAAIALPAYSNYQEKVKVAQAVTDISAMGAKLEAFWEDAREYPDTLGALFPGAKDPWGNAYVYTRLSDKGAKGKARKDHKLNPINSHFDLFSMGKDGTYKTQVDNKDSLDDVIWARDGRFVGKAEDF